MIIEFGFLSLIAAFALGFFQAIWPIFIFVGQQITKILSPFFKPTQSAKKNNRSNIKVLNGNSQSIAMAVPLTYLIFGLILIAYLVLTYAYVTSDFSVLNVVQNSHSEKPMLYKISGVWGNHEGSMLLWVLILSFFSSMVASFGKQLPQRLKTLILTSQNAIAFLFLSFIIFTSNPFIRAIPAPLQGKDLNPILQDIGLAIHPPLLYLGYVGFSVCFSFAVGALIDGRVDATWARWVRPWALLSWIFLTGGIMVGSYWAYYELGWGGYWFWDPVENASLMPWLAGTALLHSAIVLEKRGALKIWTLFLAILTFSLSLMGTFLVRSGILSSVHSFAIDPARGFAILLILCLVIGISLVLFAWRAPYLKTGGLFRPISREGLLVFNNLFLTTAAATVFIGTLYPLLLETITGQKISVGPPFFNLTFIPLMVPLLFMMPFGPMMAWKRGDILAVAERLWFAFLLAFIAIAIILMKTSMREVLAGLGIGLACFVFFGGLVDLAFKSGGFRTPILTRFKRLTHLPRSIFGIGFAHMGLGVTLFGIVCVATFGQETILTMQPSDMTQIAGKTIKLAAMRNDNGPNYSETQFDFELLSDSGAPQNIVTAAKRFYPVQKIPTTEAGIHSRWFSQLYIAPGDVSEQGLILHIWWKPFVICIWFGAMMMMFGGILSLSDRRLRIGAPMTADKRRHTNKIKEL